MFHFHRRHRRLGHLHVTCSGTAGSSDSGGGGGGCGGGGGSVGDGGAALTSAKARCAL
jgi:hypothetical protein